MGAAPAVPGDEPIKPKREGMWCVMSRIILVAGTRHAGVVHRPIVAATLTDVGGDDEVELRHGGAPGLDLLCDDLARGWGWTVAPVRAVWSRCDLTVPADLGGCPDWAHRKTRRNGSCYCPYAGPRRNQWLVDRRPQADYVLVFPAGDIERRSGTRDLWTRAIRAGLNVHKPTPLEVDCAGTRP